MTEERYRALEYGESVLTYEELNEGWHFKFRRRYGGVGGAWD